MQLIPYLPERDHEDVAAHQDAPVLGLGHLGDVDGHAHAGKPERTNLFNRSAAFNRYAKDDLTQFRLPR